MEGSVDPKREESAIRFQTSKDAFTWLLDSPQRTRLPLIYE
jgi:hypothetical protein